MDALTESLLRDLESSPTDLKRLVVTALWRSRSAVAIEAEAIARWERDDPRRWESVRAWLLAQGITITVLKGRTTPPPPPEPLPPSAPGVHG